MRNIIHGLILFSFLAIENTYGQTDSKFVWVDEQGSGRQQYVVFQYQTQLEKEPESAWICLFADSRYQLFINGQYLQFGPIRFYQENPRYDSLDIRRYMKKGSNLIAVKVLSNGVNTFQIPANIGGFKAWGKIQLNQESFLSLSTPGNWLCQRDEGFDPSSPKISFALHPIESYNALKGLPDWASAPLPQPQKAVILKNQKSWGKLQARNIPFLTHEERLPQSLLGMYTLKEDEDIYSFRIKTADATEEQFRSNPWLLAYTYIYSPKEQDIEAGLWWGEFWMNGEGPLREGITDKTKAQRKDLKIHLKEGWNYLFIKYGVVWGFWDFYMALPKSAGLIVSPDKTPGSENIFYTAGPFPGKEDAFIKKLKLPLSSPLDLPKLSTGWTGKKRGNTAGNPAWEMAWSYFDKSFTIDPSQVCNFNLIDSNRMALVFDLGNIKLGNIQLDFTAPEGTLIDIALTEDMVNNRPYILKRSELMLGARYIAREGKNTFLTFNPYGGRYLQVNISKHNGKPVNIQQIKVVEQIYPFTKKGSFECSDPMMNSIWELGYRCLRVCSEDAYTDTPVRERGLYAGDVFPEYAITLACCGDSRLLKRCLELFQDKYASLFSLQVDRNHSSELGDYPILTTLYWEWYIMQTGDLEFAKRLYPHYARMMSIMEDSKDASGLICTEDIFVEWTPIRKNNYSSTVVNSLSIRAYEAMANIGGILGYPDSIGKYTRLAENLKNKLNTLAWDESKGAYTDGSVDGKNLQSWYPISSAMPLLFGYPYPEMCNKISDYLRKELEDIGDRDRAGRATPYGGFYFLGALYQTGDAETAEKFIRKYWSPMVLKSNDCTWENFSSDGPQGTMSHAWSGAPTYYLSTQVLGVALGFPANTDLSEIIISPQAESIQWARGCVPHPKGNVYVEWKVEGDRLILKYKSPEGIPVKVLPRGRLGKLIPEISRIP